ncbi:hypothetical protein VTL71DRAFT_12565 [Oculimacula yallundae]|uniref:DUF6594 domain-containing protein n=1 Tax=Oculimacula yallundae TaxID=86028 RepID=A0ABR4CMX8_9HELO
MAANQIDDLFEEDFVAKLIRAATNFEALGSGKDRNGQNVDRDQAQVGKFELKHKPRRGYKEDYLGIKDYHETDEALTLRQTLLNSKPPAKTTVDAVRDWFSGINNGRPAAGAQLWTDSYLHEPSLAILVAVISSIMAAVLLFGSIASLYFVRKPYSSLGMLGGWTVIFAICVGWLTNSRRDQTFTATAAYCAVLVVFVSGNLGADQVSP